MEAEVAACRVLLLEGIDGTLGSADGIGLAFRDSPLEPAGRKPQPNHSPGRRGYDELLCRPGPSAGGIRLKCELCGGRRSRVKIHMVSPDTQRMWRAFPLRIPGGSRCTSCQEETVLVQSMTGGFVTRNCPRCNRSSTVPFRTFKQLGLWVAARVTKATLVLIEHMDQVGDLRNRSKGEPTLTMAVAFCLAATELDETLGREVAS